MVPRHGGFQHEKSSVSAGLHADTIILCKSAEGVGEASCLGYVVGSLAQVLIFEDIPGDGVDHQVSFGVGTSTIRGTVVEVLYDVCSGGGASFPDGGGA